MFIVICNSTQTLEDCYVHSVLQQYTKGGEFLFAI
jgi:hypothetical protein